MTKNSISMDIKIKGEHCSAENSCYARCTADGIEREKPQKGSVPLCTCQTEGAIALKTLVLLGSCSGRPSTAKDV